MPRRLPRRPPYLARKAGGAGALGALCVALLVAACQHDAPPAPPQLPLVGAASVAADRSACTKSGGHFENAPAGKGAMICIRRTHDFNKRCTRASDCEGACLAVSGTCSPLIPLLGCQEILTDSGTRVTQCVN